MSSLYQKSWQKPCYGNMIQLESVKQDLIQKWLEKIGLNSKEEKDAFLSPSYDEHLHDPYLMRDMEKSVSRIKKAIDNKEKIFIFTDYDCDGIPGAVVLHDFLKKVEHEDFYVHVPHREEEGYGLSISGVDEAVSYGADLIITIDLGITAIEEVRYANEKGVDVIITDHHLPKDELPEAFAILNPKIDEYPEKMLCGSGVVFKLVQGFLNKHRKDFGVTLGWEKWSLDMVGLATLSDMVPLLGENRVFAKYGLLVMKKVRRLGLRELLKKFGVMYKYITEDDVYFSVTPAINSASRMDNPRIAFDLLCAKDEATARELANKLYTLNQERKKMVTHIMKDVYKRLDHRNHEKVIVVGDPSWRAGVLGLIASKVVDKYNVPAFVWGGNGGEYYKGSVRGVGGVDIVKIMENSSDKFETFGGHKEAGGFTISLENVHTLEDSLREKIEEAVSKNNENVEVDFDIDLYSIDQSLHQTLDTLGPFGVSNPKPVFRLVDIDVVSADMFGKTKNHLSLSVISKDKEIRAIKFFADEEDLDKYKNHKAKHIFGHVEKSYFRGNEEVRFKIVD